MVKKLSQYVKPFSSSRNVPDRHTDRPTELLYQYRASVFWRAIKVDANVKVLQKNLKKQIDNHFTISRYRGQYVKTSCTYIEQCNEHDTRRLCGRFVVWYVRFVAVHCWITWRWFWSVGCLGNRCCSRSLYVSVLTVYYTQSTNTDKKCSCRQQVALSIM